MTPAEKLASTRPIKRAPRNLVKYTRKVSWNCGCRELRMSLLLSFDEAVKAIGISRTAYWQIEHGGDPMLTTARKIAAFYGREVWDLWKTPKRGRT